MEERIRNPEAIEFAHDTMQAFAERTGLTGSAVPRRYLWTDAFAVCNFLALDRCAERLGERPGHFLDLALALVDQVHDVLGAYAPDDPRSGWLGGADDPAHERHPTAHGLRIGKPILERPPGEVPDPRAEWDRDGQYFHYLTRWMHALLRMAEATGEPRYHRWAVELFAAASRAFVVRDPGTGGHRMVWKMSVDLDRPQVASMGLHDPLDGWITALVLRASPSTGAEDRSLLEAHARRYRQMCGGRDWSTDDTLGIGGLLLDAWRLFRHRTTIQAPEAPDLAGLLSAAASGLVHVLSTNELRQPAAVRLAFRELGLALGLRAAEDVAARLGDDMADSTTKLRGPLEALVTRATIGDRLCAFWRAPEHRDTRSWRDHADINDAMLVAALLPEGVLGAPVEPTDDEQDHASEHENHDASNEPQNTGRTT